jgi:cytochrome c556
MKFAATLAFAAVAVAMATPAAAQFAKPEDAVKYRQSAMFIMGQHFGRIGAMANGRIPYDAQAAATSAEIVADMAKLPWPGFAANTDKLSQKAKSEIWSEAGKFKDASEKLQDASVKLAAAAKTNNLENVKAAFQNAAGTCKNCHDAFRNQ